MIIHNRRIFRIRHPKRLYFRELNHITNGVGVYYASKRELGNSLGKRWTGTYVLFLRISSKMYFFSFLVGLGYLEMSLSRGYMLILQY